MSSSFSAACILLASQHPIFIRHVGVGRDELKSITLFINPSPTHTPAFTHVTHLSLTRVVTSATVYHSLCLVYFFFFLSTLSFTVQIAFGPIRDNE